MEKPSNLDELDKLIAEEKMQSDQGVNEAEIRNNIRNSEKISREVKAQLNEKWKKEDTDRITVLESRQAKEGNLTPEEILELQARREALEASKNFKK